MQAMQLDYLDFDYSEDAEGNGTFDAMASAAPAQLSRVEAEIVAVLAWAHGAFPDACGPEDEGGEWQYDLQGVQEVNTPLTLHFDAELARIAMTPGTPLPPRTTFNFTIGGNQGFCAALREAFQLD